MHVGAKIDAKRYADFMVGILIVVGLVAVSLVLVSKGGIRGL